VAADDSDEPGVLGNLPRSRPGRRSDKRGSGTGASTRKQPAAGATAKRGASSARASATAPRAKPATAKKPTPRARPKISTPPPREEQRPPAASQGGDDPLTQAVKLAGKVAETGVKTGVGILKRLSGR
jgi:hypothetical protein